MSPHLQDAERERLALLGADEDTLRQLDALVGAATPDSTVGRVYAVDLDRVSLATAAGVTTAAWAVDSLPAIGDWAVMTGDEVVAHLPHEVSPVDGRGSRADYEERRDDPDARRRHKKMWMAREADGDSRARP